MKLPCSVCAYKKGFTLIELLLVIAIIATVSGLAIPTFSRYTKDQSLKQAQEVLKSELRSVQNKALVGTGSDSMDASGSRAIVAWGVYTNHGSDVSVVANTKYRVFMSSYTSTGSTGCTDVTRQADIQVLDLPPNITFTNTSCIIFRMEDGNVSNISESSSIDVNLAGPGGSTKTVRITHPGLIRSYN